MKFIKMLFKNSHLILLGILPLVTLASESTVSNHKESSEKKDSKDSLQTDPKSEENQKLEKAFKLAAIAKELKGNRKFIEKNPEAQIKVEKDPEVEKAPYTQTQAYVVWKYGEKDQIGEAIEGIKEFFGVKPEIMGKELALHIEGQIQKMLRTEQEEKGCFFAYRSITDWAVVILDLLSEIRSIIQMRSEKVHRIEEDSKHRDIKGFYSDLFDDSIFSSQEIAADWSPEFGKYGLTASLSALDLASGESALSFWLLKSNIFPEPPQKLIENLLNFFHTDPDQKNELTIRIKELLKDGINLFGHTMIQLIINPKVIDQISWLASSLGFKTQYKIEGDKENFEAPRETLLKLIQNPQQFKKATVIRTGPGKGTYPLENDNEGNPPPVLEKMLNGLQREYEIEEKEIADNKKILELEKENLQDSQKINKDQEEEIDQKILDLEIDHEINQKSFISQKRKIETENLPQWQNFQIRLFTGNPLFSDPRNVQTKLYYSKSPSSSDLKEYKQKIQELAKLLIKSYLDYREKNPSQSVQKGFFANLFSNIFCESCREKKLPHNYRLLEKDEDNQDALFHRLRRYMKQEDKEKKE